MTYKNLPRRAASDKILCDKEKHSKNDEYQRGLAPMVYIFFDKKASCHNNSPMLTNKFTGANVSSEIMSKGELNEELHKPIIRKFEKQKVRLSFMDNI